MLALMRRHGAVVLVGSVLLVLTGRTSSHASVPTASPRAGFVDPLDTVTSSKSPDFVDRHVSPVLHRSGDGPTEFTVQLSAGKNSLRSYLTCAPTGSFKVTIAGKSYSSECGREVGAIADIPVPLGRPRSERVSVVVAARTHFKLLLLPTPAS